MSVRSYIFWGLTLAIVLLPGPVVAQVATDVGNEVAAARQAGDFSRAIALLESADRDHPNNPTTLRLLGSTYAFAHRYDDAVATLLRAHTLAPLDSDITLALSRVYLWSGNYRAARATADQITANEPGNAELPDLIQSIERARIGEPGASTRPIIGIAQSFSGVRIGGANRTWYETIGTVSVPLPHRAALTGEIDREDRSGTIDTLLNLRVDRRFGVGAYGYVSVSGTPGATFRERWGARAGGEARVARVLSLSLDLRYADYGATTIVVVEPGAKLNSRDNRYSLAIRSINLWGEARRRQGGWSLRAEAQPTGAVRLFAGGATYPDTEAGITRRVRSAFAGATVPVGEHVLVRLTYEHENRASSYTRDSAIIGASWRF